MANKRASAIGKKRPAKHRKQVLMKMWKFKSYFWCPWSGCTKNFKEQPMVTEHVKKCHSGIMPVNCEWDNCGQSCKSFELLEKHETKFHYKNATHKCTKCDKACPSFEALKIHFLHTHTNWKKTASPEREIRDTGSSTDKESTSSDPKTTDSTVFVGENLSCTVTESANENTTDDLNNDKSIPSNVQSSGTVASQPDTAPRMRQNTSIVYECNICEKRFKSFHALDRHKTVQHMDKASLTCTKCNEQFNSFEQLKEHFLFTHTNWKKDREETSDDDVQIEDATAENENISMESGGIPIGTDVSNTADSLSDKCIHIASVDCKGSSVPKVKILSNTILSFGDHASGASLRDGLNTPETNDLRLNVKAKLDEIIENFTKSSAVKDIAPNAKKIKSSNNTNVIPAMRSPNDTKYVMPRVRSSNDTNVMPVDPTSNAANIKPALHIQSKTANVQDGLNTPETNDLRLNVKAKLDEIIDNFTKSSAVKDIAPNAKKITNQDNESNGNLPNRHIIVSLSNANEKASNSKKITYYIINTHSEESISNVKESLLREALIQKPLPVVSNTALKTVNSPSNAANLKPSETNTSNAANTPSVRRPANAANNPSVRRPANAANNPSVRRPANAANKPLVRRTANAANKPPVRRTANAANKPSVRLTANAAKKPRGRYKGPNYRPLVRRAYEGPKSKHSLGGNKSNAANITLAKLDTCNAANAMPAVRSSNNTNVIPAMRSPNDTKYVMPIVRSSNDTNVMPVDPTSNAANIKPALHIQSKTANVRDGLNTPETNDLRLNVKAKLDEIIENFTKSSAVKDIAPNAKKIESSNNTNVIPAMRSPNDTIYVMPRVRSSNDTNVMPVDPTSNAANSKPALHIQSKTANVVPLPNVTIDLTDSNIKESNKLHDTLKSTSDRLENIVLPVIRRTSPNININGVPFEKVTSNNNNVIVKANDNIMPDISKPANIRNKNISGNEDVACECRYCLESINVLVNGKAVHRCSECGIELPSPGRLKDHFKTHTLMKLYVCKTCGKRFLGSMAFGRHSLTHNADKINNMEKIQNNPPNSDNGVTDEVYSEADITGHNVEMLDPLGGNVEMLDCCTQFDGNTVSSRDENSNSESSDEDSLDGEASKDLVAEALDEACVDLEEQNYDNNRPVDPFSEIKEYEHVPRPLVIKSEDIEENNIPEELNIQDCLKYIPAKRKHQELIQPTYEQIENIENLEYLPAKRIKGVEENLDYIGSVGQVLEENTVSVPFSSEVSEEHNILVFEKINIYDCTNSVPVQSIQVDDSIIPVHEQKKSIDSLEYLSEKRINGEEYNLNPIGSTVQDINNLLENKASIITGNTTYNMPDLITLDELLMDTVGALKKETNVTAPAPDTDIIDDKTSLALECLSTNRIPRIYLERLPEAFLFPKRF